MYLEVSRLENGSFSWSLDQITRMDELQPFLPHLCLFFQTQILRHTEKHKDTETEGQTFIYLA